MIHQHYEPQQILWFLRNFWKFTRDGMIAEWHRTFEDQNFGKSQYQWLKSRYGMKAEWGAALNHPPYPGARPGAAGTEAYEPPEVPTHPPRMTYRTSSDSPTPHLVTASPGSSKVAETPRPNRSRRASASTGQGYTAAAAAAASSSSSSSSYLSLAATSALPAPPPLDAGLSAGMATGALGPYALHSRSLSGPFHAANGPIGTGTHAGSGTYGTHGIHATHGTHSTNGTYAISLPMGLGSPFMPTTTGSFNDGGMGSLMPSFAMPVAASTPHTFGGPSDYTSTSAFSAYSTSPQTLGASQQPLPPSLSAFPFASNTSFHNLGGEYCTPPLGSQGIFGFDSVFSQPSTLSGLCIGSANPYARPPGSVPESNQLFSAEAASSKPPVGGDTGLLQSVMETAVSPLETPGPIDVAGKRKRMCVDVDCQPQKRPMLDPSLDPPVRDDAAAVAAAPPPPTTPVPHGGGLQPSESKSARAAQRKKPALSPHTQTTTPAPSPASASTVSTGSSASHRVTSSTGADAATPVTATCEWHDGAHDSCPMGGRHRHDSNGGIYFAQPNDFVAAAVSHSNHVAQVSPQPAAAGTSAVGSPAQTGAASAEPTSQGGTEKTAARSQCADKSIGHITGEDIDADAVLIARIQESLYGATTTSDPGVSSEGTATTVAATCALPAVDGNCAVECGMSFFDADLFGGSFGSLDHANTSTSEIDLFALEPFASSDNDGLDLMLFNGNASEAIVSDKLPHVSRSSGKGSTPQPSSSFGSNISNDGSGRDTVRDACTLSGVDSDIDNHNSADLDHIDNVWTLEMESGCANHVL